MIKTMIRLWRRYDLHLRRFWCHRRGHLAQRYGKCIWCFERVGDDVPIDRGGKMRDTQKEIKRLRIENKELRDGGE